MKRYLALFPLLLVAGCGTKEDSPLDADLVAKSGPPVTTTSGAPKQRKLANSDYPSWQVYDVAGKLGLIDITPGGMGALEKKYNIDFVLDRADYTKTIEMFGSGACDAVTITNVDILPASMSREAVAIMPTSTSQGADACIVIGIDSIAELKGKTIYGAEKSVSEFAFWLIATQNGLKKSDYTFSNMAPPAAAAAMLQGQDGYNAIMVWEPQVEMVLHGKSDSKVLFDSTKIPMKIIDMVVMGKDALTSEGGEQFAQMLCEIFYTTCAQINTDEKALIQLGEDFANLDADQMKIVRSKCRFFDHAELGLKTFADPTMPATMGVIEDFSRVHELLTATQKPVVAYKEGNKANLTFNSQFMKKFLEPKPVATKTNLVK